MKQIQGIVKRIWKDLNHYKWGILFFLIYYVLVKKIFHAYCPVVIVSGIPCPACGLTRASFFLITGQFIRAYHMHPLIFLYGGFGLYVFVKRYILNQKIKYLKLWIVLLLLSLIITYLIRMYLYFPGHPPISYTRHNLLEKHCEVYNLIMYRLFGL